VERSTDHTARAGAYRCRRYSSAARATAAWVAGWGSRVFMSVNPVLAALVGLVVLGQSLGWAEWLAIATIVSANTVSVLTAGRGRAAGRAAADGPRRSS
jgi:hypothetical protein